MDVSLQGLSGWPVILLIFHKASEVDGFIAVMFSDWLGQEWLVLSEIFLHTLAVQFQARGSVVAFPFGYAL